MPPRVAGARRNAGNPQPNEGFQQLNLPPLQGTPSSRRQYAYGASAEPLPPQATRGFQRGSSVELNQAVEDALSKQSRTQKQQNESLARSRAFEPRNSKPLTESTIDEEDELAMDERAFQKMSAGGNPHMHMLGNPTLYASQGDNASDIDDLRSFDAESDFFGEATIASTPAPVSSTRAASNLSLPPSFANAAQATSPQRRSGLAASELRHHSPSLEPEDFETGSRGVARTHNKQPSGRQSRGFLEPMERNHQQIREPPILEPVGERGNVEDEENTPTPKRLMERRARRPPSNRVSRHTTATQPDAPTPSRRRRRKSTDKRPAVLEEDDQAGLRRLEVGRRQHPEPANGGKSLLSRLTPKRLWQSETRTNDNVEVAPPNAGANDHRQSLFTKARAFALASSPIRGSQARYHPSNESEQDDEMQRQIERDDREAEREGRRQERAQYRREQVEAFKAGLKEGWEGLKSYPPLSWILGAQGPNELGNEYLLEERSRWLWLRWLNPWTYLVLVISTMGELVWQTLQAISMGCKFVGRQLKTHYSTLLSMGVLAGAFVLLPTLSRLETSIPSVPQISMPDTIKWSSVSKAAGHIRDRLPPMPSLPAIPSLPSLPSFQWPNKHSSFLDLLDVDEEGRLELSSFTKVINREFAQVQKATKLHEMAINKLDSILPKVVHMPLKHGKMSVSDEFWHALRERIRNDGDIMTFDEESGSYSVSSPKQWKTILQKLLKDPAFDSKINRTAAESESRARSDMSDAFDTWLKNNKQELEKLRSADGNVGGKRPEKGQQDGALVSKTEFLQHVKNEFATYRSAIKAELDDLRPQLNSLNSTIKAAVDLALQNTPKAMTSAEITKLVKDLVRNSVAGLNLEALAKGEINVHWDAQLKHQVNYFTVATGAIINKKYTSPEWSPKNDDALGKAKSLPKTLRDRFGPNPPTSVFHPWLEDGDRWCAARTLNRRGNPHGSMLGITMGYRIIPTHFVLEHILAGATIDPDSRPKDVELYASIEDAEQRQYVAEFSTQQFPPDRWDWDYQLPEEFDPSYVKIGEFRYEGADSHDGRYVYRLSSELEKAATDSIIIRAVSNYGSRDHTCFYQVRMYGDRVDE